MKTILLALLCVVVISSMPAEAGQAAFTYSNSAQTRDAKNSPAKNSEDVDANTAAGREKPDAVLLRANQTFARALGGARTPVLLRALLCEASFLPPAARRDSLHRETTSRNIHSPVVIIHFPRPPPSVSL